MSPELGHVFDKRNERLEPRQMGRVVRARGYGKLDSKLDLSRGVTWQLAGYVANSNSCSSSSS